MVRELQRVPGVALRTLLVYWVAKIRLGMLDLSVGRVESWSVAMVGSQVLRCFD